MRDVVGLLFLLVAGLSPPEPMLREVNAVIGDSRSTTEDLENNCSLGCAIGWTVTTSSAVAGHPGALCDDGKAETSWAAEVSDRGGASISFHFPRSMFFSQAESVRFSGFHLVPAVADGASPRWRAAGPKTMLIVWNQRPVVRVRLADGLLDQFISFPNIDLKPGDVVEVRITEVHSPDADAVVAIAELVPMGAH